MNTDFLIKCVSREQARLSTTKTPITCVALTDWELSMQSMLPGTSRDPCLFVSSGVTAM